MNSNTDAVVAAQGTPSVDCPEVACDFRVLFSRTGVKAERTWNTTCASAFDDPASFMRRAMELARELRPAAQRLQLVYPDFEGDDCRLVEDTVADAICSASSAGRNSS